VRDGLTVAQAVQRAGFPALVPHRLAGGYLPAAGEISRTAETQSVTIDFRRPNAELGGPGLLLTEALGEPLPPPTGAGQLEVRVRGTVGRWSPVEHRLEWVERGAYVALSGPSFDLSDLLAVAGSLEWVAT
jgi:hypothetical protein